MIGTFIGFAAAAFIAAVIGLLVGGAVRFNNFGASPAPLIVALVFAVLLPIVVVAGTANLGVALFATVAASFLFGVMTRGAAI